MTTSKRYSRNTGKPIRVFLPNTFLKNRDRRQATGDKKNPLVACFLSLVACCLLSSCVSHYTYPANKVPESIEKLCRDDYKLEVTARVVGKTVGALLYVDELVDAKGQIPREVHEKMGKVLQVVSRVALSTELEIDFCSVVLRDRKQNNELTITRSVDDTRRANAEAIGVDEAISRTLFDQGKYTKDTLGESPFLLKEVRLENFLADQIVQRIRYNFSKNSAEASKTKKNKKDEEDDFNPAFILVDGAFENFHGKKDYRFSILSMKAEDPKETMLGVFKTVNDVLAGYKFTGFNQIEIQDYLNRQKLVLDRETLLNYQKHKLKDSDIIDRFLQETQTVQEAFKLFGFNATGGEQPKSQDAAPAAAPNP